MNRNNAVVAAILCGLLPGISGAMITFERDYFFPPYNNSGRSIELTHDGGYIIGAHGGLLVRIDSFGDTLWTRSLPEGGGSFAIEDTNRGYISAGTPDGISFVAIWLDSLGVPLSSETIITPGGIAVWGIAPCRDGGAVAFGEMTTDSFPDGYYFSFIRLGSDQTIRWVSTAFDSSHEQSTALSVQETPDSGFIAGGIAYPWYGPVNYYMYLVRADRNGRPRWRRTYPMQDSFAPANAIRITHDGNYVLAAGYGLIKVDTLGNEIWSRSVPGYHMDTTRDQGFILMDGRVMSRADSLGNAVWVRPMRLPQVCWFNAVRQAADGGFIAAGDSAFRTVRVLKVDSLGLLEGVEETPGPVDEQLTLFSLPNPFHSATAIRFQVESPGPVALQIRDVSGRLVRTLGLGTTRPGRYSLTWDGRDDRQRQVPGGIYFVRLDADGYTESTKLLLMR